MKINDVVYLFIVLMALLISVIEILKLMGYYNAKGMQSVY